MIGQTAMLPGGAALQEPDHPAHDGFQLLDTAVMVLVFMVSDPIYFLVSDPIYFLTPFISFLEKNRQRREGDGVIRSYADDAIPESEWLSEAAISEVVEELVGQFQTEFPIRVIEREVDVLPPDTAGADETVGVVSGFVRGDTIYLVREGLADRAAVVRTLWHELLHYGLSVNGVRHHKCV